MPTPTETTKRGTAQRCNECGKPFTAGREHHASCGPDCRKARWARLNPRLRDVLHRLSPSARVEAEQLLRDEELRPTPGL